MIPPSLAISAATAAIGVISSIASNATSNGSNGSSTSGTGSSTGTNGTGTTGKITDKKNDVVNQAEFMKLLVAQLANQDPLNPLDSANFSAQLAQFSSLEQLTQINQKLADQVDDTKGRFEAVSFIGREVTGGSLGIAVKDGVGTKLDYELTTAGPVRAKIVNDKGQEVASLILDAQGVGKHTFDLAEVPSAPDLDDGVYAVVLSQADAAGSPKTIPTTVTGRVTGVDLTGDEPVLLLGDLPLVLSDVIEIKESAAATGA